jgi:Fungal domain of unknown function (DUF1750)
MWIHKSGYHPPNEGFATHCRKRYRLTPPRVPNPALQPPDPALWIVHYSKASPQDQIRADKISIPPQLNQHLAQRRWIQSQGQLIRKEFMLHDRNNWPTVNVPNVPMPQQLQNPYQQNAMGYGRPGYPPQVPVPGPTGSRRNQPAMGHGRVPSLQSIPPHEPLDEEEDISRGDVFDYLTPRDISKHRYRQMHEWMEEIWATPFSIGQIVPVSLGLGRKGELEPITKDFFDTPLGVNDIGQETKSDTPQRVGRMEAGKADEFVERANKKLAMMRDEIARMKKVHERRMDDLASTKFLKDAERRLRDAVYDPDPSSTTTDAWRLKTSDLSEEAQAKLNGRATVGDVTADVEAGIGRKIVRRHDFNVVQKAGIFEPSTDTRAPPAKDNNDDGFDMSENYNNGNMMDTDMDMGNTAGSLLDQFKTSNATTPAPLLATPTPNGQDSYRSHSSSDTPAALSTANTGRSPYGGDGAADEPDQHEADEAVPQVSDMDVDIEMAGVTDEPAEASGSGAEEQGGTSPGDWVMVSNDEKPEIQEAEPELANETLETHETPIDHPTTDIPHSEPENTDNTPGIFGDTPGGGLHGLTPADHGYTPTSHEHLHDHLNVSADTPDLEQDPHVSSFPAEDDFGNIDSIGDELEGYADQNQELDLADLDNSAFGDAFHASDGEGMEGMEGNGNGNGNIAGNEHEHGADIA